MFQFISDSARIPFMSLRIPAAILSLILCIGSLYFVVTKGLNYGVDFAGGVQMVLDFKEGLDVNEDKVRSVLNDMGLKNSSVQRFGTEFDQISGEYIVHFSGDFADDEVNAGKLQQAFSQFNTGPDDNTLSNFRFSGLEKAYFQLNKEVSIEDVRAAIEGVDFEVLQTQSVNTFGSISSREYEIVFNNVSSKVLDAFQASFPGEDTVKIEKIDFVGARVGKDLKTAALLSVLVTILLVFIYIFLRFDLIYAPGVVLALGHDVLITTGLFSLLGIEFDLTVVAALLTVAGYSINDTIIVYDRIREVAGELKGKTFSDILDLAINQTLNRTIITSGTTLMATVILWVFGGPVIHSFAFALTVGIFVGTYSSIFVASALVLWVDAWSKRRNSHQKLKKDKQAVA